MTLGAFNDTSHNQGSHCFLNVGPLKPEVTLTAPLPGFRLRSTAIGTRHYSRCSLFLRRGAQIGTAAGFPVAQRPSAS